jgi:hypothetical protein
VGSAVFKTVGGCRRGGPGGFDSHPLPYALQQDALPELEGRLFLQGNPEQPLHLTSRPILVLSRSLFPSGLYLIAHDLSQLAA